LVDLKIGQVYASQDDSDSRTPVVVKLLGCSNNAETL